MRWQHLDGLPGTLAPPEHPSVCLLLAACPQSPHTSCSGIFICLFGRVITISKCRVGKKDLANTSQS